jgi:predicted DNA-binding protein
MARPPRFPEGAMSNIVAARVPDEDHDRLIELARRKGMKHPEMVRQVIMWGLERAAQIEREEQARLASMDDG